MTVQYQGVWTLQSAAQLQSTQRWVTDPLFDYTTLLLQADDAANGAQNNTFLDSSSNSFAITRNGNTTQGSFTPFSQSPGWWSNYFDGTGDYLTLADNAAFDLGTADFTFECWVYKPNNNEVSFLCSGATGLDFAYITAGGDTLRIGRYPVAWDAQVNYSIPQNVWTHIAFVKASGRSYFFANGILLNAGGTANTNSYDTTTTLNVAVAGDGSRRLTGYMTGVRLIKGQALATTNFTPSAVPVTTTSVGWIGAASSLTGTVSLLTCQSNRFIDASSNAFAITVNGDPSVQAFSPFAPQFQWTPSVIGGSGYFDGSDFLSVPDNVAFTMGAGDFALEAWVYVTATSGSQAIFGTSNSAGSAGSMSFVLLAQNSSGFPSVVVGYAGALYSATSSEALTKNQWNHIAGVRNGATVSIYVNGVSRGTLNMAALAITDSTEIVGIGRNGNFNGEYLTGYIASARIVKGSPVYTANFTPPTAPLTAITNTQLLCNFTNAGIYDGTMKNNLETVGNAQVSTAVVKYGSGSMFFDGTGDYLRIPTSQTNSLGSGSWTIEFWVYRVGSGNQIFYDQRSTATQLAVTIFNDGNNILRFFVNGANQISDTGTFPASTWTHVAVSKLNSSTRMFVNGVQVGSTYADTNTYVNNPIFVGAQFDGSGTLNGYIDDLRVTLGIARYTQNFIPPSVALPRQ
jgi:hypothetical protein